MRENSSSSQTSDASIGHANGRIYNILNIDLSLLSKSQSHSNAEPDVVRNGTFLPAQTMIMTKVNAIRHLQLLLNQNVTETQLSHQRAGQCQQLYYAGA
jgi:hypothetical protein